MFHITKNYLKAYEDIKEQSESITTLLLQHKDDLHLNHRDLEKITLPEDLSNIYKVYTTLKAFQYIINKVDSTLSKHPSIETKSGKITLEHTPFIILKGLIDRCTLGLSNFLKEVETQSPYLIDYDSQLDDLSTAIENHDKALVKELLDEDKTLVYRTDNDEWGPLHFCAAKGTPEIMKLLIEDFNSDINQKTAYSYTAAQIAAQNANIPCLIELINHGADIDITNRGGMNTLDFLAEKDPGLQNIITHHPEVSFNLIHQEGQLKVIGDKYEYSIEIH